MVVRATEEQVRESIGFKSLCQVLDQVFPNQWEIESLYHEYDCLDFSMWLTINHQPYAAYLSVIGTCHHGHPPIDSGRVSIEVPTPPDSQKHLSFDRVWITPLRRLIPGIEEKYCFGEDARYSQDLIDYVLLLKQYLAEHPTPTRLTRKPL